MARIRDIKPDFFLDEDLARLTMAARLCFVGLWTLADREGRLEDRPARIRAQLFPYEPGVDVEALLLELVAGDFLVRYVVDDRAYLQIRSFGKHQHPHPKEAPSTIPPPPRKAAASKEEPSPLTGEPGKETASHGEQRQVTGEPLHAGSSNVKNPGSSAPWGSGSSAPLAGARDPWRSGYEWCQAFGRAWASKYRTLSYGNGGDGKAQGALEEITLGMPEAELVALWGLREKFFGAYLASPDEYLAKARHPFALFVSRFSDFRPDLRKKATAAAALPVFAPDTKAPPEARGWAPKPPPPIELHDAAGNVERLVRSLADTAGGGS